MASDHDLTIASVSESASESATDVLKRLMSTAAIPSFRELGRRAEISDWAIQQLRRDRITTMRLDTLQRLASALQISLPEFLTHFGLGSQPTSGDISQTTLEAEYQRLQTQLKQQESQLQQRFQRDTLTIIEPWVLQWPTVAHAVAQNPDLPAARVIPLVQPIANLLAQWGITAIAPIGAEIPYDPQKHQLMDGTAQVGDRVRVRYAGFMQGEVLLYRAKVSPVGG